jgi:hypothetical protein
MDHEKRRADDEPIYQVFKNWQFYASAAMALVSVGGFLATFRIMSSAVQKGEEFQIEQIALNTRLTTLIETHDHRIQGLEDWRNGMDYWNRGKAQRSAHDAEH